MPLPLPAAAARGCGGSALLPEAGTGERSGPPHLSLLGPCTGAVGWQLPVAPELWGFELSPCGRLLRMFSSPLALQVFHWYQRLLQGNLEGSLLKMKGGWGAVKLC